MKLSVFIFLLLLVGCASVGHRFDAAAISNLEPGVTTETESRALLGQPHQVVNLDNGGRSVHWQYISSTMGGITNNQAVSLFFDSEGRFVRIFQLVNIPLSAADEVRLRPMSIVTQ